MDQHVCEAKGITTNHPVAMSNDPFPLDLHERRNGDNQPDHIQQIESHTAYFAACRVGPPYIRRLAQPEVRIRYISFKSRHRYPIVFHQGV